MKLRPATREQLAAARSAYEHLQCALRDCRTADCPQLAPRIQAALRSADGARRHIERRVMRSEIRL